MKKKWIMLNPDSKTIQNITHQTGCHPVIAAMLTNRGITSNPDLSIFLNPSLTQIRSYHKLIDIEKAVQRISDAIIRNEKIMVFGDYDVDGITSTVILFDFLTKAGAKVSYYIPNRITEGYGLNKNQIINIAKPLEVGLIITVDCGSGSHDAICCANELGIDVIIADHHKISSDAPKAFAIINPRRLDCPSDAKYLAGVGVVFHLLIYLRKHLRDINLWDSKSQPNLKEYCDLVALGTISDIVPMVKENRIMTKTGIDIINTNPRPGLKALIGASGVNKPYIDADDIAYRIAPRINAAGRIEHADLGVSLLLTQNLSQASILSEKLNILNSQRQKEENIILDQIEKFLKEEQQLVKNKTLVLSHNDLHEGVLGIVASRLVEKFYRPVLLISFKDGIGKGSGRSIPGINIYNAIESCSDYLENFGGHPMAAGIRIKSEKYIPFKNAFENKVLEMTGDFIFEPSLEIDYEMNFDIISEKLIDQLESLQPFGPQNPEPKFISKNIEISFSKNIGQHHRRMLLKQKSLSSPCSPIPAVWFNADQHAQNKRHFEAIVYKLRKNYWNGSHNIQLIIEDAR